MVNVINFCSDYALFDRYISGDKNAGEQLFANAFPIVERYVYSKTKEIRMLTNQDKEEIVSEAFCRAIDKRYDLKKGTKFSSFVIGFAKNIIKEKCTEKQKDKGIIHLEQSFNDDDLTFIDFISDTSLEGRNPLEIIIKDYDYKMIKSAFERLPKDYRDIITLRIFIKLKNLDIAKMTNQNLEATRSLYRRAIIKLKENLKN